MESILESLEIIPLSIPLKKPITTNLYRLTHITCLYLMAHTKQGITGHCLLDGIGKTSCLEIMLQIENHIIPFLEATRNLEPEIAWQQIWQLGNQFHANSAWRYALASLDIALWDVYTKERNISLCHYLGIKNDDMSVYGSSGWFSLSDEELLEECQWYASKGVNAFKLRLGHQNDISRVALIREKMGNDFLIMVDANQRYSIEQAAMLAGKLKEFNICWFEEPITTYSLPDLKRIAEKSSIPLALGENIYDQNEFLAICKSNIAKYIQPDVVRIGGVSPFVKIAEIVEENNLSLCNHLLPELSVSILSAFSSSYLLEHDNCLSPEIFKQDFNIINGKIKVPTAIGTGVELKNEALIEYSSKDKKTLLIQKT